MAATSYLALPAVLALLGAAACSGVDALAGDPGDTASAPEWTTAAPFPERRTEVSAASDGRRMFVVGGFSAPTTPGGPANAPRTLWAYDPTTNAWQAEAEIPEGINHAGLAHVDGRLYLVGGFRENSFAPTGAVRIFEIASRQWSSGAPMPTPRGAGAVVVVAGRIHAIGGNVSGAGAVHEHDRPGLTFDNSVGTHEVYDPGTNSWARLSPMPTSRNHHGAAAVAGRIHVIGGRASGDLELTAHEVYDPVVGTWQVAAPLPTGRSGIAVVERAGRIYVFGGEAARTFDDAERFDPASGGWVRQPPMPSPRHGLGAAVLGDQIHVVSGGPTPGFSFGNAHERLGPDE